MLTHSSHTAHARQARGESGWPTPLHEAGYWWVRRGNSPHGQFAFVFARWEHVFASSRWLTFTDRGFSCPFHICFTRPVLRSTCQEEPRMAGVYQGVAEGRQVDGSHVGMGWRFRLSAGMGWNGIYALGNTETLLIRNLTYVSKERKKAEMTTATLRFKLWVR